MQWNSGHDKSVEVNQRALIDKVLARYSGEFTGVYRVFSMKSSGLNAGVYIVFRELLQNSDDASSTAVEIRFETKKYVDRERSGANQVPSAQEECLPDLKTTSVRGFHLSSCFVGLIDLAQVHRWTLKNNGMIFREEDWNRLRMIGT